jgi:hypothetical protein
MTPFTVRSRHHLAQPPNWRITPCRLSATAYSIHSQLLSISAGRSSIRNLRTRHAVVTGTHLSMSLSGYVRNFKIVWPCIVTNSLWMKLMDVLNSIFICIKTLHVSGSLSAHHKEFLAVHRHWYILCRFDDRLLSGAGSIRLLTANGHQICRMDPAPDSKRSSNLHKMYQRRCTAKNFCWWAERLPEICRVVIPIKLEFRASVGFIHKSKLPAHRNNVSCKLFIFLRNTKMPAKCPWRREPQFRNPYPSKFCSAAVCVCFVTDFFRNSSPQLVSSGIDYLPWGPGWPPRTTPIRDEMASLTRLIGHQTQPQFSMTSVYMIQRRGLFGFTHWFLYDLFELCFSKKRYFHKQSFRSCVPEQSMRLHCRLYTGVLISP